jgi:transposase
MIKVDTYKYIKDLHVKERKSIRQISREVGLSRQTIRKILYGSVEETTTYKRKAEPPAPLRSQFEPIIKEWLIDDQSSPRKQRHNSQRIFERLQDEHEFTGGSSTVRGWVRDIKRMLDLENINAFMPLEHDPLGYAQCDWTPAMARITGQDVHGELFLLRFSHSKAFYVRFYPHQRQEAFFDAHEHAFTFFNGIPGQILYDNLKTAVKKVLVGRKREEQDAFLKFRAHHGFDSQFCNPAKGNEKGIIEGLARYIKAHAFTPVPEFPSIEALNDWLAARCRTLNARPRGKQKISFLERFEEERAKLLPLSQHTFDCCSRKEAKVNHYSLIAFDKNQYSVPVTYPGRILTVKGYIDEVRIYDKETLVAVHSRSYESGKQLFILEHYFKLLERKPRSVGQAKPVRQANLPAAFAAYHRQAQRHHPDQADKLFVTVLLLLKHYPVALLAEALEKALAQSQISVELIQSYAEELIRHKKVGRPNTQEPGQTSSPVPVAPTAISRYRQLHEGGVSA